MLSDLYAMGITECDNMLMLLSVSQKMNEKVEAAWSLVAISKDLLMFPNCLHVWITGPRACDAADDSGLP